MSRENLTTPSKMDVTLVMESIYSEMHGDRLCTDNKIIENVVNRCKSYFKGNLLIPEDVLNI